jgi:hypothetical protein
MKARRTLSVLSRVHRDRGREVRWTQPTVLGGGGTDDAGRFDQLCWCIGTKGSMVDSAGEHMRRLR